MSRYIPNENSWVGFVDVLTGTYPAVDTDDIAAATDLTPDLISLTASSTGNTVPTPSLDTLFETSVPGTATAQFSADFYRDDVTDDAWEALPRGTKGYFIIGRGGLTGTTVAGKPKPVTGNVVEIWPVQVTSRAAGPMTSNTAQVFTVTCAVLEEPDEDVTLT